MNEQVPSNQWNTPWRASGFAVYDTIGNLVAHTGITGNRSMHGKQLELMAAMIAEAVNAYSAHEPPAVRGIGGTNCIYGNPDCNCTSQPPSPDLAQRVSDLERALVYSGFHQHGTPEHQLPPGIRLIDWHTVEVKIDDRWVSATYPRPTKRVNEHCGQAGCSQGVPHRHLTGEQS